MSESLREKLARMSIAEIDAMSDEEVAALMGATSEELARQPVSEGWREAAILATDEWAARLAADVEAGRVAWRNSAAGEPGH